MKSEWTSKEKKKEILIKEKGHFGERVVIVAACLIPYP